MKGDVGTEKSRKVLHLPLGIAYFTLTTFLQRAMGIFQFTDEETEAQLVYGRARI